VLWEGKDKVGGNASVPAWAGDRIVVGSADGRVCALSSMDGRLLWSRQTGPSLTTLELYQRGGNDVNSSPAVYREAVYVGASDGRLRALALGDGAELSV
jgi:outer membrane protein assembly factor BamB